MNSARSLAVAAVLIGLPLISTGARADEPERSVSSYEALSPYGDWIEVDGYGRVWRPFRQVVGVEFMPYGTGGHWIHTEEGWMFEADWDWGWLPFHYGRWYQDDVNGWVWLPGDVWAPAWVEWRFGGGYIGWEPIGPPHHSNPHWVFVESQHFSERDVWRHRSVGRDRAVLQVTRSIAPPSGHAVAVGPAVEQVRAVSRVPIIERKVEEHRPVVRGAGAPPPPPPGSALAPVERRNEPAAPGRSEPGPLHDERGPRDRNPPIKPEPTAPERRNEPTPVRAERGPRDRSEPARAVPSERVAPAVLPTRNEPARPTEPIRNQERPPVPAQAMPSAAERQEPKQRMLPSPIREPSQPPNEPLRPPMQPAPVAREPARPAPMENRAAPVRPAPQPENRAPPPAAVKRPQPQPVAPAPGPAPVRGPRSPERTAPH